MIALWFVQIDVLEFNNLYYSSGCGLEIGTGSLSTMCISHGGVV